MTIKRGRHLQCIMGFEVFERKRPSRGHVQKTPIMSVSRDGRTLVFNSSAARLISELKHAVLMFDAETRSIALVPTTVEDPMGYRVSHVPSAANVSCPAFIRSCHLERGARWGLLAKDGMFYASAGE